MRKPVLLFFVFTMCFWQHALAQPYLDLAAVQLADMPVSEFYKGADEARIDNNLKGIQLNIPIILNQRNVLLFSPGYRYRSYFQNDTKTNFYTLYFPLALAHTFEDTTNKIVTVGIYRYNASTDFKMGSKVDMLGGAVLFNKTVSKKFIGKLGVYYNREFFGNYFLPLLGCEWHPSEKIFIFGTLPQNAVLDYTFCPALHGGINYLGFEESYKQQGVNSYSRLSEGLLKFFVDWYIPRTPLVLSVEVGNTVGREYTIHSEEDNVVSDNKFKPAESMVFRTALAFRFVTNKEFMTPRKPAL